MGSGEARRFRGLEIRRSGSAEAQKCGGAEVMDFISKAGEVCRCDESLPNRGSLNSLTQNLISTVGEI